MKFLKYIALTTFPFALAACGGGGGGTENPSQDPPVPGFSTVVRTDGLDLINPYSLYGTATGQGVTVAVVDTGVEQVFALGGNGSTARVEAGCVSDVNPDSGGNFVVTETCNGAIPTSTSNRSDSDAMLVNATTGLSDDDGHGTAVAGVIAGYHPDQGWQGIAPEATIMAIDAYSNVGDGGYFDIDIGYGIVHAVKNGAQVINLSLGCPQSLVVPINTCTIGPNVRDAVAYATGQGVAVIFSAGNDGNRTDPNDSTDYFVGTDAALAGLNGLVLAVGSVDDNGVISHFSNTCTSNIVDFDEDYCLTAPGEGVLTTGTDGSLIAASGTSFSAPYVSGAIALLMSADPTLTAAEAIQIILMTATAPAPMEADLYGAGTLNLSSALAPVGLVSATTTSTEDIANAQISLSKAFGDALQNSAFLQEAVLYDSFDRAYVFDLTKNVELVTVTANTGVFHADGQSDVETMDTDIGDLNLSMSYTTFESDDALSETGKLDFFVSHAKPNKPYWFLGYSETGADYRDDFGSSVANATLNMTDTFSSLSLVGSADTIQSGYGFSRGKTEYQVTLSYLDDADSFEFRTALRQNFTPTTYGIVDLAFLDENSSFLGSTGMDSASESYSAETVQLQLGLGWSLGDTEIYASYMHGASDVTVSGASLLSAIDDVEISALTMAVAQSNIVRAGDSLGLSFGMPTKVVSGSGSVEFSSEAGSADSLSLTPSGTQKNIELAYQTPLSETAWVQFGAAAMFEPGHDADAATEYAVGVRLTSEF